MSLGEKISLLLSSGAFLVSIFSLNQSRKANKISQEINYNKYYRFITSLIDGLEKIKSFSEKTDFSNEQDFLFIQKRIVNLAEKTKKTKEDLDLPKKDLYFLKELDNAILRLFEYLNYHSSQQFNEELNEMIKKLKVKIGK